MITSFSFWGEHLKLVGCSAVKGPCRDVKQEGGQMWFGKMKGNIIENQMVRYSWIGCVCFFCITHYAWLFTSFFFLRGTNNILCITCNLILIRVSHVRVGPGYSLHFFLWHHHFTSMKFHGNNTMDWKLNTLRFAFDKYLALLLELCPTDLNRLLGTQSQSEVRFWLERWKWRGSGSVRVVAMVDPWNLAHLIYLDLSST